jgi:CRP/FNR family transcriptional regulator
VLQEFPAFAPIVSDAFDSLTHLPDGQPIGVGHVLLGQGSTADSVYLLREGLVKLTHVTSDGREATLGLRSSGWYAGAVSVLMKMPSVYAVTAVTACSVSRISATDFALTLSQNSRLMRHFVYTLCNESMSQSASQAQMMAGSAEDRLKHFLRERKTVNPRFKTMDTLPLLKQLDLARLLSITPEHLSRLMRKTSVDREEIPA